MAKLTASKKRSSSISPYNVQRVILGVLLVGLIVSGLVLIYQDRGDDKEITPEPGTAIQDDAGDASQADANATTQEEE